MPSATDCWGIEVGSNAIKAIRLQRQGAEASLVEFDVIPFKKILTTPDLDVDEAVRVGLDQFLSRHNVAKSSVVISVPGHMAFARFAKLPPVEPKKIPDIVRFEAVQQIPFPIEQVEWDYQTFQDADSPDVEVGIFAITKDRIAPWLSRFVSMGMNVHAITIAPVAAFNGLNYDMAMNEADGATILMDIGTQATDLVIADAGRVWSRTIPIGGNHFTDALVKSFKLSFSKAEKLKREASTSKYARQIFQAMRPVFVDLVQEVQKSLGFYQSVNRDVELTQLIGLGSTWRLPGLQTFLKQQLQLEVSRLDQFQKIEAEGRSAATFAESTLSLAPAYGLALQGVGLESVSCNLLPSPIIHRQVWKAKQPAFAAAAALVVLGVAIAAMSTVIAKGQFNSQANKEARQFADSVLADARKLDGEWNSIKQQENPTKRIENIRSMLTYRDLWAGVMSDINQAMGALDPQPELLSGDIEKIKAIPRTQRRQMFIRNLTFEYQPPTRPEQTGFTEMGTPMATDEGQAKPGRYLVTLEGVTPFASTGESDRRDFIIARTFNQWLASHGSQPGRMYRIPSETIKLEDIGAAYKPEDETGQPGGMVAPRFEPVPEPINRFGAGGGSRFGARPGGGRFGNEFEQEFQPNVGGGGDQKYPPIPKPLLADENRSTDKRFVVKWVVEVLGPEDLNKNQNAAQPGGSASVNTEAQQ